MVKTEFVKLVKELRTLSHFLTDNFHILSGYSGTAGWSTAITVYAYI